MKNIFNTHALKRYVLFSLHHHPTIQYFLHPSKEISFWQRDRFANGGETINASFKGKDTGFFCDRVAEAERPRKTVREV